MSRPEGRLEARVTISLAVIGRRSGVGEDPPSLSPPPCASRFLLSTTGGEVGATLVLWRGVGLGGDACSAAGWLLEEGRRGLRDLDSLRGSMTSPSVSSRTELDSDSLGRAGTACLPGSASDGLFPASDNSLSLSEEEEEEDDGC